MRQYLVQTQNGTHVSIIASYFDTDGMAVTFYNNQSKRIAFFVSPQSVVQGVEA